MFCKFTVFFILHGPVILKLSLDHMGIVIGVVSTAVKEGLKHALNSSLNNSKFGNLKYWTNIQTTDENIYLIFMKTPSKYVL